ncbi:hypothetical protein EVAR_67925_1 [Eumeta japonica]|uniref:Uncharacterized protein n=1 Tax=Eumeta variegata TaxID=151549 RepID=A0A4C1ZQD3_EUMVA|nr:hypothetical protein EVAR_67925_1 [Eumeta japonica]
MFFYEFRCRLSQQESYNRLRLTFHDEAPSLDTVYNRLKEFRRGRANLTDDLREGRPPTATTEDSTAELSSLERGSQIGRSILPADRRLETLSIAHSFYRRQKKAISNRWVVTTACSCEEWSNKDWWVVTVSQ